MSFTTKILIWFIAAVAATAFSLFEAKKRKVFQKMSLAIIAAFISLWSVFVIRSYEDKQKIDQNVNTVMSSLLNARLLYKDAIERRKSAEQSNSLLAPRILAPGESILLELDPIFREKIGYLHSSLLLDTFNVIRIYQKLIENTEEANSEGNEQKQDEIYRILVEQERSMNEDYQFIDRVSCLLEKLSISFNKPIPDGISCPAYMKSDWEKGEKAFSD